MNYTMTDHAPKTMRFQWGHFSQQILDDGSANRHEGISVVEAKRCKLVTLTANVQCFAKRKFASAGRFPEFLRRIVTVGGGFVQRSLFLAQTGVDRHGCLPRPVQQPTLLHFDLADLRPRFDLILLNVETPSLLRCPRPVLNAQRFTHRRLKIPLHLICRCHVKRLPPKPWPVNVLLPVCCPYRGVRNHPPKRACAASGRRRPGFTPLEHR
jgi:hypothetical protein